MQIGLNPGSQPAVIMNPDEADFEVIADWKEWGEARLPAEALEAPGVTTQSLIPGQRGVVRIMRDEFQNQFADVARMTDGEIREALQHLPDESVESFLHWVGETRGYYGVDATGELAEAQAAVDEVVAGAPEAEEVAEGVAQLADAVEAVQRAAEDAGLDLDVAETASEAASDSGSLYSWFSEALENAESGVEAILSDVEEFASDELAAAEGFLGEALGAVETAFETVVGAAEEAGVVEVAEVALAVALA